MDLEIKLLKRKLAKAGVTTDQSMEELLEEAKADATLLLNDTANPESENSAAGKLSTIDQLDESSSNINKELSEFEVKELDVLKFKHEQDISLLKKEYADQLDFINNRVKLFSAIAHIEFYI